MLIVLLNLHLLMILMSNQLLITPITRTGVKLIVSARFLHCPTWIRGLLFAYDIEIFLPARLQFQLLENIIHVLFEVIQLQENLFQVKSVTKEIHFLLCFCFLFLRKLLFFTSATGSTNAREKVHYGVLFP